jgi:hypothetical protein
VKPFDVPRPEIGGGDSAKATATFSYKKAE